MYQYYTTLYILYKNPTNQSSSPAVIYLTTVLNHKTHLIIKQSGATSRTWEPNDHYTYSLICIQDNKYGCLICLYLADSFTNSAPHVQQRCRSVWEMRMTMTCRICQSWSNTMAKERAVSCCASWKMKNAPALYLELMDGVLENKEERGRERQKIEKKVLRLLWRGIILFPAISSSSEPIAVFQPTFPVKPSV